MSAVSTRLVPLLVKTSLSKVSLVSSEPKNSSFTRAARVLVADNEAALPTPRPFALLLKATRKLLLPLLLPTLSSCSMMVLSSVILWRRPLWPLWIGSCPRVRLPVDFFSSFSYLYLIANIRRSNLSHLQRIPVQGPDPYSTPIPVFVCAQTNVHHLFRLRHAWQKMGCRC